MTIDPLLLEVLACPSDDHAPVRVEGDHLVCTFCGTSFPIDDGLPVMLIDDATPGPNGIGKFAGDSSPAAATAIAPPPSS